MDVVLNVYRWLRCKNVYRSLRMQSGRKLRVGQASMCVQVVARLGTLRYYRGTAGAGRHVAAGLEAQHT